MVIVSFLHMITAQGSIYLMVVIVCEAERRGRDGGEGKEEDAGCSDSSKKL